jgi:hypothetical protein
MKTPAGFSLLFALCLSAFVSCGKSDHTEAPNTEYSGVKVEWPKLDTEFAHSDPELQASADMAKRHIRYSRFPQAEVELDKLFRNPKLTESQKKVVSDLREQTKQVMAKAPPPG